MSAQLPPAVADSAALDAGQKQNGGHERAQAPAVWTRGLRPPDQPWPFAPASFVVRAGEALCLRGASGSGKSTLLALLGLLRRPLPEQLWLWGEDAAHLTSVRAAELRQRRLGLVRQANNLLPQLTAAANVTLQARLAGLAPDTARLHHALEALDLLALAHRPAHLLSGGEAARVALARVCYQRPALVLVDEPSAAQDPARTAHVLAALCALRDGGSAVILATHDAELADALGPSYWLDAGGSA